MEDNSAQTKHSSFGCPATAPTACPRDLPQGPLQGGSEAPDQILASSGLTLFGAAYTSVLGPTTPPRRFVCPRPVFLRAGSQAGGCLPRQKRVRGVCGVLPDGGRRRCSGVERKRGLQRRIWSFWLSRWQVSGRGSMAWEGCFGWDGILNNVRSGRDVRGFLPLSLYRWVN